MPAHRYDQSYEILGKQELCPRTWRILLRAPLVARKVQAGQFIMVRPNERSERMPLSIAGWDREGGTLDLIISATGFTSEEATALEVGEAFHDVVGPLGQPAHIERYDGACVLLGGGYGSGAILPVARALKALGNTVIAVVGARQADLLLMVEELTQVCDRVEVTTNDGSAGTKGFVTHALTAIMQAQPVSMCVAVGPVPMMKAVADLTRDTGVSCAVSINAIMLDGTGMCGACRVTVGDQTRFACVDGPDFDGHLVDFDELMTRQRMFAAEEHVMTQTACARRHDG